MADPKHPRHFTDEFKRQIIELVNAGKPKADVMWDAGLDRLLPRRVDARRQKADGIMDPFCLYVEQRRDAIRLSVGKPRVRCAERVEQQVACAFDNGPRPFHSVARLLQFGLPVGVHSWIFYSFSAFHPMPPFA